MRFHSIQRYHTSLTISFLFVATAHAGGPSGTAFTYQGQLKQGGVPVSATCDFEFTLWDDPVATLFTNQVGPTLIFDVEGKKSGPIKVVNGLFQVELDMGVDAFNGDARWLQINVCCSSPCAPAYTTLKPRQALTPTPYALFALNVSGESGDGHSLDAADGNPVDALFVDNSGNVGIGTTSPAAELHVQSNSLGIPPAFSPNDDLVIESTDAILRLVSDEGGSTGSTIIFSEYNGISFADTWVMRRKTSGSGSGLDFSHSNGDVMRLEANGNVGIGTTAPQNKLHVVGSDATTIVGQNSSGSGSAIGVRGESASTSGRGVYGLATASTHTTYGVYGESASTTNGHGVYGVATSATGNTYGVRGQNFSTSGRAVDGEAIASTGETVGVSGSSSSTSGRGVNGLASAISGTTYGVRGESRSATGTGVFGLANDNSGSPGLRIGVRGEVTGRGRGVFGLATSLSDSTAGVFGESASTSGVGVRGKATAASGNTSGVAGEAISPDGYGVFSEGDFGGTGAKYFIQPHPTDASKEIRFISLEGNESGTYFRGSSRLVDGRVLIDVPEEFRLVTESEGLTVQLTAKGPAMLWYESKDLDRIVIRGDRDVEFDYFVNGVRRGFANHVAITKNRAYVPDVHGLPFGTQYRDGHRRMLVENGTLNADFTPSVQKASDMGWSLRDPTTEEVARYKASLKANEVTNR